MMEGEIVMEKVLEMKPCKECGKLFRPKSAKSIYCDGEHYRPCPVCGKPVFAKYLSDPARCCSGVCRAQLGKLNKLPKVELTADMQEHLENDVKVIEEIAAINAEVIDPTDDTVRKKYEGPSTLGWNEGHEYAVKIVQEGKSHVVKATYNYTAAEAVELEYGFSNKKKISTIFKAVR